MRGPLLSSAIVLATVLAATPLLSQSEVTTVPIGNYIPIAFRLTCPTNMLMIGMNAGGTGLAHHINSIRSIDCSFYKADGTRFGPTTTIINSDPTAVSETHLVCPSAQAVAIVRTHVTSDLRVDYVEMYCATIGPNGGRSTPVKAGSIPAGISLLTNGALACPGTMFAHGAASVNNGLALTCIAAPVMANAVSSVALAAFHTVAGSAVQGTVTLNGYAVGAMSVGLGVSDAPGAVVPTSITIPDGARSGTFQVQSATSTAGCSTVHATLGTTSATAPLVITPAPPSGATFTFSILPTSTSLVWGAPSTLTAIVAFTPTTLKSGSLVSGPSVTFASSQPDVLAIQSSPQRVGSDTVKVTMNALKSGCAVVTATVDGVLFRKTLRLASGL